MSVWYKTKAYRVFRIIIPITLLGSLPFLITGLIKDITLYWYIGIGFYILSSILLIIRNIIRKKVERKHHYESLLAYGESEK